MSWGDSYQINKTKKKSGYFGYFFHVLQNVIINESKYSKFAVNNPQHVTELSNKAIKFRNRVKKLCHISNNLKIGKNVHYSLNIKGLEKLNITATTD